MLIELSTDVDNQNDYIRRNYIVKMDYFLLVFLPRKRISRTPIKTEIARST